MDYIRDHWRMLVVILSVALIVVGGSIFGYQYVKQHYLIPKDIEQHNEQLLKKDIKDKRDIDPSYDAKNVQSIGKTKAEDIDPSYLNGVVVVPSVNIKLPILEGISNNNLNYGAGTMKPNQQLGKGNYALAGHYAYNHSALFTPLENVQIGAKVYMTDKNNVYEYKVQKKYVVDPTHTEVIKDKKGKKMMTLVTCNDVEGHKRIIVQGNLENVYDVKDAPNNVKNSINY